MLTCWTTSTSWSFANYKSRDKKTKRDRRETNAVTENSTTVRSVISKKKSSYSSNQPNNRGIRIQILLIIKNSRIEMVMET